LEFHRKSVLQMIKDTQSIIFRYCVCSLEKLKVRKQSFVIKSKIQDEKKESLHVKLSTKYFSFNERKAYTLSKFSALTAYRKYCIFCKAVFINVQHRLKVGLKHCLSGLAVLYTHFKRL